MKRRIESAMNHLEFGPMSGVDPAAQLTRAKGADRHRELGPADLLPQMQEFGLVEFLRAVHGKAVRGSPELAGQHRNLGRIGAEMSMHVLGAVLRKPRKHATGFSQVDEMHGQGPDGAAAHLCC